MWCLERFCELQNKQWNLKTFQDQIIFLKIESNHCNFNIMQHKFSHVKSYQVGNTQTYFTCAEKYSIRKYSAWFIITINFPLNNIGNTVSPNMMITTTTIIINICIDRYIRIQLKCFPCVLLTWNRIVFFYAIFEFAYCLLVGHPFWAYCRMLIHT